MGRLGDLLVDAGVISADQLTDALRETARSGHRLGETLVVKGWCTEADLANALARQISVPRATEADLKAPADGIGALIPVAYARRYGVAPLRVDPGGALVLAMADPTDQDVRDELRFSTGHTLEPRVATMSELRAALDAVYGAETPGELQALRAEVGSLRGELAELRSLVEGLTAALRTAEPNTEA